MVRLTVVNDNPEVLGLFGEILEADRYVTTLIDNVQDDLLRQICRSSPDLLVIDPRHGDDARHGWEIVKELRRTPDCEHLPVVMCSADIAALNEVESELEATPGVMALKLPFEVEDLLQSIRRLIGSQEAPKCS